MPDTTSRFKRPEHPATPTPGSEAERFIHGPSDPPEAPRVDPSPRPDAARPAKDETPKPEPMKRLTIDIPESLHKRVKSQCGAQGSTIADVVRHYLDRKFPEIKS